MNDNKNIQASRRRVLVSGIAGAGVAVLSAAEARAVGKGAPAALPLTAQTTEGPYYFDARQVRADITEGLHGVPLEIRLTVLDQAGIPLKGMRVDVWHCNAEGVYSGYAGQGDGRSVSTKGATFLRGSLATDVQGIAAFRSIYPGWYEGRTTHIHFKVMSADGSRTMLTTQFFLPDALSEFLYTRLPDYQRSRVRETLNSNDGIALMAGSSVIGAVREGAGKYVASLSAVVDKAANPVIDRPPAPGEGPPPGMPHDFAGRPPSPPPGGPMGAKGEMKMRGPHPHGFATEEERIAALVPGNVKS
ncbi:intradiol ring-cleavage dioxygenase [Undibacterium terreum]|uniref:Twin-arginine translocation pathway signal protein n=1 Tax=Undibacterium terreum TaxID=1224302 RepID=A0A916U6L5_9BURK|nr:intradiol ring-cleavage dioxygenase [Undibacterium terreum]GGC62544.1 twin-arginine translocation pathway signal protein [Undibacterium terreum]